MIELIADKLGKKYRREWVFRHLSLTLGGQTNGEVSAYTFVGPNGSGKSTLLQILAGAMPVSEGMLSYKFGEKICESDQWFRQVILAAPYLELIEELTLIELLTFHQTFKPFKNQQSPDAVADQMQLSHARQKEIKYFSSGMKQRVKLGLAFFSEASVVILDEPTSNLDRAGVAWYQENVRKLGANQLLLIGSNQPEEYDFCPNVIDIMQWK
jgi:ABC-2 type transport system ATP-binding protein